MNQTVSRGRSSESRRFQLEGDRRQGQRVHRFCTLVRRSRTRIPSRSDGGSLLGQDHD